MSADVPAASSRPRPWLLVLLGISVVALVAMKMWPASSGSAVPPPVASNQTRTPAGRRQAPIDPSELDVRLEALQAARPGPGEAERNPFRFEAKAPPPSLEALRPPPPPNPLPDVKPGPPPPPPITIKYIGLVERRGSKVAMFSDCKSYIGYAAEGQVIDGRYRLVRIQVESVVVEYVNGTGRTTIRQEGCPAR